MEMDQEDTVWNQLEQILWNQGAGIPWESQIIF